MLLKSLIRTLSCLLAAPGLLAAGMVAAPAHAAPPSPCAHGQQAVEVVTFNTVLAGPLWAPLDQEQLERQDRDGDGLLCVRTVALPSTPPGVPIPPGEANVLVLTVDTPGGRG